MLPHASHRSTAFASLAPLSIRPYHHHLSLAARPPHSHSSLAHTPRRRRRTLTPHALTSPPSPNATPPAPPPTDQPLSLSEKGKPPLPPSSHVALTAAYALSAAALGLPPLLALQHPLPPPFWPHFIATYAPHYRIIAYTAAFAILHSGLASLRPLAVRRVGERLYRVVFALLSIPSATALVTFFIAHRYDPPQLWALQGFPALHPAVFALTVVSFLLLYPATFNLLEVAAVARPTFRIYETGVTRITRHPQLWGQILWCVAHTAWLGSSFAVVASLCLVAHHCFGAWNGDRRLRDAYGDEWRAFADRTSIVPFAAAGKQTWKWREFLRPAYVGVGVFVWVTYAAHPAVLRAVGGLHW